MTEPTAGARKVPDWEPPRLASDQTSVFHYTSAAGLLGAVESGTLWATEASGLNDPGELNQGWAAIKSWLSESEYSPAVNQLWALSHLATDFEGVLPLPPYVLCASLDGDDAAQWRLYADAGRGYAIELDTSAALAVTSSQEPLGASKPHVKSDGFAETYPWAAVAYDAAAIDRIMASAVRCASEVLPPTRPGEELIDPAANTAMLWVLFRIAACIKGPGFAGEREARVLSALHWGDRHVDFHANSYGVVRHARLAARGTSWLPEKDIIFESRDAVAAHRRLPIRSVTLGPAHNERLAAPAVEALLARHGYDVPVHASRVTLR